jgi:general L-amino acid transport system permease protein
MTSKRNLVLQLILITILFSLGYYFYNNAEINLTKRGIASGFGFLNNPTGFDIIMHLIDYSYTSTYWRAFFVGILNTLLLSSLAIIFATIFGTIVGTARLAHNWLIAKLATVYVELFRNIPLLLQIFFWYYILLNYLPQPDNSFRFFHAINLNIRGLYFPLEDWVLIPELMAMLLALTLYSTSYIAEIVRSGILSVDYGQTEAASAVGLSTAQILRLIVFPQALRAMIPPLTSQYLNITKNSSLSAAIGYPDLVSVFAGTALNQTGQAIETIFMTMSVYLFISLSISLLMNWYNQKVALVNK